MKLSINLGQLANLQQIFVGFNPIFQSAKCWQTQLVECSAFLKDSSIFFPFFRFEKVFDQEQAKF